MDPVMAPSISTPKGIFLFSSTIVGAGILALPVAAAEAGFIPLAIMLLAVGAVSILSGLYIAEATLAHQEPLHLPSLARKYLGPWGIALMMLGIMINIYGALVGYLAAGGQVFLILSGGAIPVWLGTLIYFVIGSTILHRGLVLISRVNTWLMYLMLVLLAVVMGMAAPKIQVPLLVQTGWHAIFDVFGIVLFAYLGHAVIPSIAFQLRDRGQITLVVAVGIALPCILYLAWSFVVLGVVPAESDSEHSLATARAMGHPATVPLGFVVGGSVIILGKLFAALSTMTSYIGLGVSLRDSYSDLAVQRRRAVSAIALTGVVVIPPLLIALANPGVFVQVLDIAGTFGGGIFIGILPVLILFRVRRAHPERPYTAFGGAAVPWFVAGVYALGILYAIVTLVGS